MSYHSSDVTSLHYCIVDRFNNFIYLVKFTITVMKTMTKTSALLEKLALVRYFKVGKRMTIISKYETVKFLFQYSLFVQH